MTKKEKTILVTQGIKLMLLGLKVERARRELKRLCDKGMEPPHPRLAGALERYQKANGAWRALEQRHLALRERLRILS